MTEPQKRVIIDAIMQVHVAEFGKAATDNQEGWFIRGIVRSALDGLPPDALLDIDMLRECWSKAVAEGYLLMIEDDEDYMEAMTLRFDDFLEELRGKDTPSPALLAKRNLYINLLLLSDADRTDSEEAILEALGADPDIQEYLQSLQAKP